VRLDSEFLIQNLNALLVRLAHISCNLLTAAEHLFGYFSQAKIPNTNFGLTEIPNNYTNGNEIYK